MESTLISDGRITIPKALRVHLSLKPGDRLQFFVHPDGHVAMRPKLPAPRHKPQTLR